MKHIAIPIFMIAGLVSACQTTTHNHVDASTPTCENPHDKRDKFIARMLTEGNTQETIQTVREGYIRNGAEDPEKSGSYLSFIELLTGTPNPNGPEETANYKVCFDRFSEQ
jgi:hypothetical protein